jgi:hypothetical protein
MDYMLPDELKALFTKDYSKSIRNNCAIDRYQMDGYEINEALRVNSAGCDVTLDTYFVPIKPSKPMVLFRGVESAMRWMKCSEGTLHDDGYMSTSLDPKIARSFVTNENKCELCCLLHIHIPAGEEVRILPIFLNCNYAKEKEILLPRGTTLQVITDRTILGEIKTAMTEYFDGDKTYEDFYECNSKKYVKSFPFTTFKTKDNIHVILYLIPLVRLDGQLTWEKITYKGKVHQVHVGPRGGRYINVGDKFIYMKKN